MPSLVVESDAVKAVELLPGEELCETVALTNRGQCAAEHIEIWARFGPRQQPRLLFTTASADAATRSSTSNSASKSASSSSSADAERDSSYEVDSAALLQQLRSYQQPANNSNSKSSSSDSGSSNSSSSSSSTAAVLPPGCTVRIPLRIRAGQPGSANAEVRGEVAVKYAASTAAGYSRWLTLPLRARPAPGLRVLRMITLMPLASSSSSSSSGGSSAEGLAEDTDAPACRLALTLANDAPVPVALWRRCAAAATTAATTAASDGQQQQQAAAASPATAASSATAATVAAAVWAVVPASGRIVVPPQSTVTAVFGMQRLR
jgi:hypothetical protein